MKKDKLKLKMKTLFVYKSKRTGTKNEGLYPTVVTDPTITSTLIPTIITR